jgi:hypothetical protein
MCVGTCVCKKLFSCHTHRWMMKVMDVKAGEVVSLTWAKLKEGNQITLKPLSDAFFKWSNPQVLIGCVYICCKREDIFHICACAQISLPTFASHTHKQHVVIKILTSFSFFFFLLFVFWYVCQYFMRISRQ